MRGAKAFCWLTITVPVAFGIPRLQESGVWSMVLESKTEPGAFVTRSRVRGRADERPDHRPSQATSDRLLTGLKLAGGLFCHFCR